MFGMGMGKMGLAKSAVAFAVSSLFANNEQGVWYDPSDINLAWRRNLLTYTEQFDNASWTKNGATVTVNAVVAPDGTTTGDKLVESASFERHGIYYVLSQSGPYTFSVFLKAGERSTATIFLNGGSYAGSTVTLNLATGVSSAPNVVAMQAFGNGWYRCVVSGDYAYPYITVGAPAGYGGDGTSGIYIWGAQLETGSTASTYQRITDGVQDYYAYQAQPVLFQDSAGTTPVTAVEQPVGLMLDKSKGLVLGSELVTSSWAVTGAGISQSGGVITFASSPSTDYAENTGGVVSGKGYIAEFTVTGYSGSGGVSFMHAGNSIGIVATANGRYRQFFYATSTGVLGVRARLATTTAVVSNISVRQLPGNHAFQATSTSRPVLSARYNLLTKTEQFDDAVWIKDAGITAVTPNYSTAPDGTTTSTRIVFSGSNQLIRQAFSAITGIQYTSNVWLKGAAGTTISVATAGTDELVTLTGGWQQYSGTKSFTSANFIINTYSGATARDIQVWHPDIRAANDAAGQPAYQRVNTATDYDTTGFKPYLRFDGTDDWLQTNSINFTGTDKMTVFAGGRTLSNTNYGGIVGLSANINDAGALLIWLRSSAGGGQTDAYARGSTSATTGSQTSNSAITVPSAFVYTTQYDIAQADIADEIKLRWNGAALASTGTSTAGTGNFANAALTIGQYNSSNRFNGRLYGLIVRGAQSTAQQITDSEKYMAALVGTSAPAIQGVPTIGVVL